MMMIKSGQKAFAKLHPGAWRAAEGGGAEAERADDDHESRRRHQQQSKPVAVSQRHFNSIATWRAYFALINVFSTKLAIYAQIEIAAARSLPKPPSPLTTPISACLRNQLQPAALSKHKIRKKIEKENTKERVNGSNEVHQILYL